MNFFYKLSPRTSENLTASSTISDRDSLDKEHIMLIWMITLLVYVIVAILFGGIYLYRKNKGSVLLCSVELFFSGLIYINTE